MAPFVSRPWPVLLLVLAIACDTTSPNHLTAPRATERPSADLYADGHQFTLVNGEYIPVGTFPAKIIFPVTRFSMSCDSDKCIGGVEVAHYGYWHATQAVLEVDAFGDGRTLHKATVPFTSWRCQTGWPCVWKELHETYQLPPLPKCGVVANANTRHEAWWTMTGGVSVGGLALSFGKFGSTQTFSTDHYENGTCPTQTGTVAGGGYSGDCYFCQQWLTYDHGVLIREEWECTQIPSSACAGLAT